MWRYTISSQGTCIYYQIDVLRFLFVLVFVTIFSYDHIQVTEYRERMDLEDPSSKYKIKIRKEKKTTKTKEISRTQSYEAKFTERRKSKKECIGLIWLLLVIFVI